MGAQELAANAKSVFGDRWLRPLARVLDCSPALLRSCKQGKRLLSPEASAKVRGFTDLGPAGAIIRKVLELTFEDARPVVTHRVAMLALSELTKAGMLVSRGLRPLAKPGRIPGPITQSSKKLVDLK